MNTSHNEYDAIEHLIYSEGLKLTSLEIGPNLLMVIHLNNHHTLIVPTAFYKGLRDATLQQLMNFQLIENGTGINWPDLDEDLSLKGFLKEFLNQQILNESELVIS